jgi:hypothetical protein
MGDLRRHLVGMDTLLARLSLVNEEDGTTVRSRTQAVAVDLTV